MRRNELPGDQGRRAISRFSRLLRILPLLGEKLEAPIGIEPMNNGFAIRSLSHCKNKIRNHDGYIRASGVLEMADWSIFRLFGPVDTYGMTLWR